MATVNRGYSFGSTELVTNTKLHTLVDSATVSGITAADIQDFSLTNQDVATLASISTSKLADGSSFIKTGDSPTFAGGVYTSLLSINSLNVANLIPEAQLDIASAPLTDYVMRYDGSKMDWVGQQSLVSISSGSGDVSAAANLTDNALVRGDGGVKGVQTSTITVSDNGEMLNTSQPAFYATPSGTQSNIATGGVTVIFGTEVYDQGGNFASNTFTAPVTGKYQLSSTIYISSMDKDANEYIVRFIASNRTVNFGGCDPDILLSADGRFLFSGTVLMDMDANDTCTINVYQEAGTAQADISAGSNFSGVLVC